MATRNWNRNQIARNFSTFNNQQKRFIELVCGYLSDSEPRSAQNIKEFKQEREQVELFCNEL